MIVSVRLNEEDIKLLQNLTTYFDNQWLEIFGIPNQNTKSDTIRSCIRRVHYDLIESNKMDNT